MVWIDYTIITVLGLSYLTSLIRGFVHEALSLVAWSRVFYVASRYYADLSVWFMGLEDERVRNGIAIVALFIVTLTIGAIVSYVIGQLVKKTGLSGTDRVPRTCFGALCRVLIIAVISFLLDAFAGMAKGDDWHQSQSIPYFTPVIRWFFEYLQSPSSLLPKV